MLGQSRYDGLTVGEGAREGRLKMKKIIRYMVGAGSLVFLGCGSIPEAAGGGNEESIATGPVRAVMATPLLGCDNGGVLFCKQVVNEPYCFDPFSVTCQVVLPTARASSMT